MQRQWFGFKDAGAPSGAGALAVFFRSVLAASLVVVANIAHANDDYGKRRCGEPLLVIVEASVRATASDPFNANGVLLSWPL